MQLTIDQALQRGIEAHKAGNFQEADKYYTAILKAQPKHSDANHNLGVLAVCVGKITDALPFFERALKSNPSVSQYWLSYINALLKLGRINDAQVIRDEALSKGLEVGHFVQLETKKKNVNNLTERTKDLELKKITSQRSRKNLSTEEIETLKNLYDRKEYQELIVQSKCLLNQLPDSFLLYNFIAIGNFQQGKLNLAIEAFGKAAQINPNDAEVHNNLGKVLKQLGKLDQSVEAYKKALSLNPEYYEVYNNLGNVFLEKGEANNSIQFYKKSIALQSNFDEAYYNMGNAYNSLGKKTEAIASYEKALQKNSAHANAKYMLSSLTAKTQRIAPQEYVEGLFDSYAANFEHSLIEQLSYNCPQLISTLLQDTYGDKEFGSVLDLGCGTGLLGERIKGYCSFLEGVDLSSKMLEKAKLKRVYDKLTKGDIINYLANEKLDFDNFICADVLIYIGDLTELFKLIKERNKRHGRFIFSTEHVEGEEYYLRSAGRFAHSKHYISTLSKKYGFEISYFSEENIRTEKDFHVVGGLYILEF